MGVPEHLTYFLQNLYASQEATEQQLEPDMEQQTGSKLGEEYVKGRILSPCSFNFYAEYIMRNAGLDEAQIGMKGRECILMKEYFHKLNKYSVLMNLGCVTQDRTTYWLETATSRLAYMPAIWRVGLGKIGSLT